MGSWRDEAQRSVWPSLQDEMRKRGDDVAGKDRVQYRIMWERQSESREADAVSVRPVSNRADQTPAWEKHPCHGRDVLVRLQLGSGMLPTLMIFGRRMDWCSW